MTDSVLQEYKNRIKNQLEKGGAIYLRGLSNSGKDIDFYISPDKFGKIKNILTNENFYILNESQETKSFFKYELNKFIIIDIHSSFSYIFDKLRHINFTKEFLKNYLSSPQKNQVAFDTIRYFFMERKKLKYANFYEVHKEEIIKNNFYLSSIKNNPFKKNFSASNAIKIICASKKISFFQYLKPKYKLYYIQKIIIKCFKKFNAGLCVAFIGADGSGKTTIISLLHQITNSRTYYMGTNNFIFEKLFYKLNRKKTNFNKLMKFFLMYFENWIKWTKAFSHLLIGRTVLLDRHPSSQYYLQKNPGYLLNKIFYQALFPNPHKIIILYADSNIILSRKCEHDKEIIENLYGSFKKHLNSKKNIYWIENIVINDTLGQIMRIINN